MADAVVCEMAMWSAEEHAWIGTRCEAPDPAYEVVGEVVVPGLLNVIVPCCEICAQGVRATHRRTGPTKLRSRRTHQKTDPEVSS